MSNLIVLIGNIAISFVAIYVFFNLRKDESENQGIGVDNALMFFLKIVTFSVFLFGLLSIGMATYVSQNNCDLLPENITLNSTTNMNHIDYSYVCQYVTDDNATNTYKLTNWYFYLLIIFFVASLIWGLFKFFVGIVGKKK